MTLRFSFDGGPREYVEYPAAEVIDSDQAVVLLPLEHDTAPSGPRNAVGYSREVAVTPNRPLGHRVLVDLDATPVMVQAHRGAEEVEACRCAGVGVVIFSIWWPPMVMV